MYYKITNENENHHGFQYVDGLNILLDDFNDDPNQSRCKGGFYFTDAANIFKYLCYGIYLREITLPASDPNFRMVKVGKYKWRANMIILGKRYELSNVDTLKYLIELGTNKNCACVQSARYGYLVVVKYLAENGTDINANNDYAFRQSARYGHLEVVKYLVEHGRADIHANNDYALGLSAENGHLNVEKYLIKLGANINANNNYALHSSAKNGHLDIVKFLVENGANIHADNDYALRWSGNNDDSQVIEYLESIASKNL